MINDPTQRRYNLKCTIKFFSTTVRDQMPSGVVKTYERTLVFLIPQESDERTRFLSAWLPDTSDEYHEVTAFIAHPVDAPVRLSVHRSDNRSNRHYLTVMSKGAEDVLLKMREGQSISIQVLKASEDSEADFAPDTEYNFEVLQ